MSCGTLTLRGYLRKPYDLMLKVLSQMRLINNQMYQKEI